MKICPRCPCTEILKLLYIIGGKYYYKCNRCEREFVLDINTHKIDIMNRFRFNVVIK